MKINLSIDIISPKMSLTLILAARGQVVVFTPTWQIGLKCEQLAERMNAEVVHTRGWADRFAPLLYWNRLCMNRESAMLSCDQHSYSHGVKLPCTDLVWVGPYDESDEQRATFLQAMARAPQGAHFRIHAITEEDI